MITFYFFYIYLNNMCPKVFTTRSLRFVLYVVMSYLLTMAKMYTSICIMKPIIILLVLIVYLHNIWIKSESIIYNRNITHIFIQFNFLRFHNRLTQVCTYNWQLMYILAIVQANGLVFWYIVHGTHNQVH